MNHLSAEAKAMRDRIINWQSPTVDDLKNIRAIEQMGEQLLETILQHCPNNHERSEAIDYLEVLLTWTRKSIIRGHGIDL
jgi:flagellar basal body-associated protein FliL